MRAICLTTFVALVLCFGEHHRPGATTRLDQRKDRRSGRLGVARRDGDRHRTGHRLQPHRHDGSDRRLRHSEPDPGAYTLTVEMPGFATLKRENLTPPAGAAMTMELKVQVAGLAEELVVTGQAPLIEKTSNQIGGTCPAARSRMCRRTSAT